MPRYMSFDSARSFCRNLGLKNTREWRAYCKTGRKPGNIPTTPECIYKAQGWNGMGDWLKTSNVSHCNQEYRSFSSARNFTRELGLKGLREWRKYAKSGRKPQDIPSTPECIYKTQGWTGVRDWLGLTP